MLELIYRVLLIAFIADTVIVILSKFGILDRIQAHAGKIFVELTRCRFCMGFWLATIGSLIGFIASPDKWWVIVPFAAAAIIRQL